MIRQGKQITSARLWNQRRSTLSQRLCICHPAHVSKALSPQPKVDLFQTEVALTDTMDVRRN